MLDEIYLRLLSELAPESLKLSMRDYERITKSPVPCIESRAAYNDLISAIYAQDRESNVGVHFGRLLRPHALCDFSRALMTAPSFRDSLNAVNELHYMQGAAYYLNVHHDDTGTSVAIFYPYNEEIPEEQHRFCAEAVFSYLVNLCRDTTWPGNGPDYIHFEYSRPSYYEEYEESFDCALSFDHPISMIHFPKECTSAALTYQNHTLHEVYRRKCNESAHFTIKSWAFDYRTVTQMVRHAPCTFNAAETSERLNISPRGLQKKLNCLNTSFSTLTAKARAELAKVYLVQHRCSIEATAEKLGFQTASGFRRFFKTEHGMSASDFVQQEAAHTAALIDTTASIEV